MTIDQFLEKLRQTPRDWRINHQILSGGLRRGCVPNDYQCPFGAVLYLGKQAVYEPTLRAIQAARQRTFEVFLAMVGGCNAYVQ